MGRGLLLLVTLFIAAGCIAVLVLRSQRQSDERSISLTNLVLQIKDGNIAGIRVADAGGGGVATTRSGETLPFTTGGDQPILKVLANLGATPEELSKLSYTVTDPP